MIAHTLRMPTIPGAWHAPGIALLIVMGMLLSVYHQTAESMVAIWLRSDTFAHAFAVPPLVLWLVWRKRVELGGMMPRPMAWALAPMACAAAAWLVGRLAMANAIEQFAFTAMMVLAVPLLLGRQVGWTLLFPLGFLFFAVPVGEFLVPTMMQWTADFTVMALRLSGIPVYREGLQFVIPTGHWSVVDACSGIRYLVASFMVGSLFAYLNYRTANRRLIFVALSILVPVVANWLRAYLTVILGHLSGNKLATGVDHLIYGWLFFGIVIMALFVIGARWSQAPAVPARVPAQVPVLVPVLVPVPVGGAIVRPLSTAVWPVVLMAVALLWSPPLLLELAPQQVSNPPRLQLQEHLTANWRATDQPVTDWTPSIQQASAKVQRSYRSSDLEVGVYIAYYRNQDTNKQLVSASNALVSGQDKVWHPLSQGVATVSATAGGFEASSAEIVAASMAGSSRNTGLTVWHWYWVGGVVTRSDVVAKLLGVWQRLTGQGDESATVVLYARRDESNGGKIALQAFARDNWTLLERQLRETSHRQ